MNANGRSANGRSKIVAVLGLAGVLAGCKVGPDFKRPEPPRAERYTAQRLQLEAGTTPIPDQQIAAGEDPGREWWHLFHSDALDAVVRSALEGNRTLVAANATLAQARELAAAQAGALYPQLAMTAGVG
ncbi:MAG TPA: hypothetical protein VGO18_36765, partial [Steroidobacteraceae bacterium]|nr:hypothetical protein [Steroidobacteraceae bacterium]